MNVPFAMVGAGGRMGRTIIALAASQADGPQLSGALEHSGATEIGRDAGEMAGIGKNGILVSDDLDTALGGARAVIDFSTPETSLAVARLCADQGIALVVGTTGFTAEQKNQLARSGEQIPLLLAPNMSPGVNLLFYLAGLVARAMPGSDVEILEAHHHFKKDAPSGTAVRLKEVLLEALDRTEDDVVYGRRGWTGERPVGEIAVHTMRGGDVVGDHTVFFFGEGERLELTHRASSRDTFASGALRAAAYLVNKAPGRYSMNDVLEIV